MLALEIARWRLARVWFVGSGLIVSLLVAQSLGGLYGDQLKGAWEWALPNMLPTLSLMTSVFVATALVPEEKNRSEVRLPFYWLSVGVSVFYLGIMLIVIFVAPVVPSAVGKEPVDVLHNTSFFLGPLQGAAAALLGALFTSPKRKTNK